MFEDLKEQPRKFWFKSPIGILAFLLGVAFAQYGRASAYIPLAAALLIGLAAKRALPNSRSAVVPALAVQGGHLVWVAVGCITQRVYVGFVDIIILSALLLWFCTTVSRSSAVALIAVQLVLLSLNLWQLLSFPAGSLEHRALTVHIVLRVLAILLTANTVWPMRFLRRTQEVSSMPGV